jgi:hypothetical protein
VTKLALFCMASVVLFTGQFYCFVNSLVIGMAAPMAFERRFWSCALMALSGICAYLLYRLWFNAEQP